MSKLPKFSPGPWKVKKNEEFNHILNIHDSTNSPIANVASGFEWIPSEEGQANARLISSAPDMYEALKLYEEFEAALFFDNEAWRGSIFPRFTQILLDKWMEIQTKRNDAIAKVEGCIPNEK